MIMMIMICWSWWGSEENGSDDIVMNTIQMGLHLETKRGVQRTLDNDDDGGDDDDYDDNDDDENDDYDDNDDNDDSDR